MRILSKRLNKSDGSLVVKLYLEEGGDDIWNLYNLIAKGDFIRGAVMRKV